MSERVLLDRRCKGAQLFPFGNTVHFAVALLPQIPEPLVVHLLVLGCSDKTCGRFRLVDWPAAVNLGATRLRLGPRVQRLRSALGVIEPLAIAHDGMHVEWRQQLGIQYPRRGAHRLAPRRKRAVCVAGCRSQGIYAASLSKLRPPGPKAMT